MRRLMIILLSVCLLSVLLLPAAATDSDADCVISVGSASAFVGNPVEVPVYLTNNPGFAGASLEFSYDTSVLKLTRISKGELLEEATEKAVSEAQRANRAEEQSAEFLRIIAAV